MLVRTCGYQKSGICLDTVLMSILYWALFLFPSCPLFPVDQKYFLDTELDGVFFFAELIGFIRL